MDTSPSSSKFLHSLPDAVAISCLARVSRLDHAALSLVSKSCRSLVVSSELYQTRSLMGYVEKYGYVCLRMTPDSTPRWFILRPTLDDGTGKTVNRAHMIPSLPSQPPEGSAVVVLDWGIYVIGGWVNSKRTSSVLLLDCRSHKWHHVTSMRVARVSPAVHVVDGKIYVLGGCKEKNSSDWGEVFDTKTQTWATLQISKPMLEDDPNRRPIMSLIHDNVVIEDKVNVVDSWNRSLYYLPSQSKWGRENQDSKPTNSGLLCVLHTWECFYPDLEPMNVRDWCVIDKLIYCCGNNGEIYWCEPEELDQCEEVGINWKEVLNLQLLQGNLCDSRVVHFGGKMVEVWESYKIIYNIKKELKELLPGTKLTNFGQNIVVFWDRRVFGDESLEVWCGEISLKRKSEGEIWGMTEWLKKIIVVDPLTVDPLLYSSKVLYSIFVDV